MTNEGITHAWKPPVDTSLKITVHRANLELIWIGNVTFTLADAEAWASRGGNGVGSDRQSREVFQAVQEQRRRMESLATGIRRLREAAGCPL